MLKVGVVGIGGISGTHIPVWKEREDTEVVAMCDIRVEQMDGYEGVRKYTDYKEMLEKEDLDILDVCLPTYLHTEVTVAGLEKGIHVLCEKPVSLHREDVKLIYDTAEKNGVSYMPAHVIRFWDEYVKLKEIYDSKQYGKLLSGYLCRLSTRPKWSWDNWMFDEDRSGLVPYDLHIHDLDFMVYLLGCPNAFQKHCIKRPEQNYLNVTYEYDDFFVTTESSWFACEYPFKAEFRFVFEKAIVACENGVFTIYENGGKIISEDAASKEGGEVINLPKTDAYANEIGYFAGCVKAGRKPEIVKPLELEIVLDILTDLNA